MGGKATGAGGTRGCGNGRADGGGGGCVACVKGAAGVEEAQVAAQRWVAREQPRASAYVVFFRIVQSAKRCKQGNGLSAAQRWGIQEVAPTSLPFPLYGTVRHVTAQHSFRCQPHPLFPQATTRAASPCPRPPTRPAASCASPRSRCRASAARRRWPAGQRTACAGTASRRCAGRRVRKGSACRCGAEGGKMGDLGDVCGHRKSQVGGRRGEGAEGLSGDGAWGKAADNSQHGGVLRVQGRSEACVGTASRRGVGAEEWAQPEDRRGSCMATGEVVARRRAQRQRRWRESRVGGPRGGWYWYTLQGQGKWVG